jgi:hypothetical protein
MIFWADEFLNFWQLEKHSKKPIPNLIEMVSQEIEMAHLRL